MLITFCTIFHLHKVASHTGLATTSSYLASYRCTLIIKIVLALTLKGNKLILQYLKTRPCKCYTLFIVYNDSITVLTETCLN